MSDTRTIWKFVLDGPNPNVAMPAGAQVVAFGEQDGRLTLWAAVDPTAPRVPRRFTVVGTGWEFPATAKHLGTVQAPNGLVWHLMELDPDAEVASWAGGD